MACTPKTVSSSRALYRLQKLSVHKYYFGLYIDPILKVNLEGSGDVAVAPHCLQNEVLRGMVTAGRDIVQATDVLQDEAGGLPRFKVLQGAPHSRRVFVKLPPERMDLGADAICTDQQPLDGAENGCMHSGNTCCWLTRSNAELGSQLS